MTSIMAAPIGGKPDSHGIARVGGHPDDRDLLLVALRAGSLRARLAAAEIDQIGVALKLNIIDTETALRWIEFEFGAGTWVLPDREGA